MAGQTLGIGNLDPTQDQLSPGGKRMRVVPDADPHRQPFRIRMARCAAFLALSIPTVATGTPGGTCTVASSASNPFSGPSANGTPMTGRSVSDAANCGRAAERSAPEMSIFKAFVRSFVIM